jgi:hypothetical protein
MLSRRALIASGVVGATEHPRHAHEPRLWVHASLMAQPAFAAVGFSITEHQVVQIGDQAFKRAYMEKPLYPSHHPAPAL